ncbi:MAG: hypothetical protein ABH821_05910 [archaeon]
MTFKIVVKRLERPLSFDLDKEFNWFCQSFGFFSPSDREVTASDIFREIVSSTENSLSLTSSELALKLGCSRGAVINHLNNLLRTGLIVKDGSRYVSRSKSLYRVVQEIERDIKRVFEDLEETALRIDKQLDVSVDSGKSGKTMAEVQKPVEKEVKKAQKTFNVEVMDESEPKLRVYVDRKSLPVEGFLSARIITPEGKEFKTKVPSNLTNEKIAEIIQKRLTEGKLDRI